MNALIEQDRTVAEVIAEERPRLLSFLRKRVPNPADVEDLLQEIFYELVRANRLLMPIDYVTGWLFSVARNRITDLFRKQAKDKFTDDLIDDDGELLNLEEQLPSPEDGPEALYLRGTLLRELNAAIGALPADQRHVFIAHEIEGRSFKEIARDSGENLNTLLSRKHYAVLTLRKRLRDVHNEFITNRGTHNE